MLLDNGELRGQLSAAEARFAQQYFVALGRNLKTSVLDDLPPQYQSLVGLGGCRTRGCEWWLLCECVRPDGGGAFGGHLRPGHVESAHAVCCATPPSPKPHRCLSQRTGQALRERAGQEAARHARPGDLRVLRGPHRLRPGAVWVGMLCSRGCYAVVEACFTTQTLPAPRCVLCVSCRRCCPRTCRCPTATTARRQRCARVT
jgi:hypothetical protein